MNEIQFGDCRDRLRQMAAAGMKVQMCVTSPPYFGLRDYGHDGQLGLEETPEQYIANMVEVFRAVRDVLADDGVLWVNIGDSYAGGGGGNYSKGTRNTSGQNIANVRNRGEWLDSAGLKAKDLIGIPWMLAFALRADGWYLRSDIIWHKRNPMPESVTDRPTKAHEYLFLLAKSPRYYYDVEAVKEPAVSEKPAGNKNHKYADAYADGGSEEYRTKGGLTKLAGVEWQTRNRRTVWSINTKPYKGAHFAVFPPDLVEPCILAGTSERGHCPACGARWERIVSKSTAFLGSSAVAGRTPDEINASGKHLGGVNGGNRNIKAGPVLSTATTGWTARCTCGHEPVPDVVLDPFMGSGTSAEVAILLGRDYAGCELNPDYKPLQDQRIASARATVDARRVAEAPAPQLDLFEAA